MTEKTSRPTFKKSGSYNERLADLLQKRADFMRERAESSRRFVEELRALMAERTNS